MRMMSLSSSPAGSKMVALVPFVVQFRKSGSEQFMNMLVELSVVRRGKSENGIIILKF